VTKLLTNHEVHRRARKLVLETLTKRGEPATLDGVRIKGCQTRAPGRGWVCGLRDQNAPPGLEYFFVSLPTDGQEAEIYRLPSEVVAPWLQKDHADWIARPGRHGQPHKDNPVRRLVNRDDWMRGYLVRDEAP